MKTFKSDISDKEFPETDRISGRTIRPMIMDLIRQDSSSFGQESNISLSELNFYREKYISQFLLKEIGELSELEKNVMTSVSEESTLSDKINKEDTDSITYGQHIADKVAIFGGRWTFIISFGVFLVIWIMVNAFWLSNKGFDPYPFILLNLILSCLAAMQAPVIMMSQNRQEEKDRERAKKDYMINLKSELEIRILHEKIDHLIMKQQQELLEIQKVQIDMMNDILTQVNLKKSA